MIAPDAPSAAAERVRQLADALADDACRLAEAAENGLWSAEAVADAVDAIDILLDALARTSPKAPRLLAPATDATTALLLDLGIETMREQARQLRQAAGGQPTRRRREVGLGPRYQGIRLPPR
ncbi:hypothetical protein [Streptomyces sp. NPDC000229]|uniref:hypothetical protein n=1 Tax=Streptomyces sp. NPDC000229 TaxID=3154247 RepID=UPI003316C734